MHNMHMWIWWILTGISLVVFLPGGLILLAIVIIKHIVILSDMKDDPKPRIEEVVENEYFENTLEKFR